MKKLDLFLIKSFLGPFVMTFLIVLFVLIMQFLWLYIDELVGKGLSLWVIIEFLAWGSATLFPLALPLATLLASIMTLGNMGENNELLALKAAGISLPRILSPLFILSIFISIAAFFASNNLIPVAYEKIYRLRSDIGKTKEEIKIPVGVFYNGVDGYSIRIVSRDDNNMMHHVMVYDHSKKKGNVSVTVADSGKVLISPDKKGLIFTLYDGINYEEENTTARRDTTRTLKRVKFKKQEIVIPLQNYAFTKSEENKYGNEVMTKGLAQLRIDRDTLEKQYDKTLSDQFSKAITPRTLSLPNQIDTARHKAKREVMNIDSLFVWESSEDELRDINDAINELNNEISNLDFYDKELFRISYPLRKTIMESYRKFTLSIACIIFFFIGAPLGAIIRKGGLGTPVIISMFFFVIYWVVDLTGKKLGNDGAISPFMGAFISTFVLLPMGIFLTYKSTQDSSLFNTDAYIKFFNNLFSGAKKIKTQAGKRKTKIAI